MSILGSVHFGTPNVDDFRQRFSPELKVEVRQAQDFLQELERAREGHDIYKELNSLPSDATNAELQKLAKRLRDLYIRIRGYHANCGSVNVLTGRFKQMRTYEELVAEHLRTLPDWVPDGYKKLHKEIKAVTNSCKGPGKGPGGESGTCWKELNYRKEFQKLRKEYLQKHSESVAAAKEREERQTVAELEQQVSLARQRAELEASKAAEESMRKKPLTPQAKPERQAGPVVQPDGQLPPFRDVANRQSPPVRQAPSITFRGYPFPPIDASNNETYGHGEALATMHMRWLGYTDAVPSECIKKQERPMSWEDVRRLAIKYVTIPDGGIDVIARNAVAQVKSKFKTKVPRADVSQLVGDAMIPHAGKKLIFYAADYSPDAIAYADGNGVALFTFDANGNVFAESQVAHKLEDDVESRAKARKEAAERSAREEEDARQAEATSREAARRADEARAQAARAAAAAVAAREASIAQETALREAEARQAAAQSAWLQAKENARAQAASLALAKKSIRQRLSPQEVKDYDFAEEYFTRTGQLPSVWPWDTECMPWVKSFALLGQTPSQTYQALHQNQAFYHSVYTASPTCTKRLESDIGKHLAQHGSFPQEWPVWFQELAYQSQLQARFVTPQSYYTYLDNKGKGLPM